MQCPRCHRELLGAPYLCHHCGYELRRMNTEHAEALGEEISGVLSQLNPTGDLESTLRKAAEKSADLPDFLDTVMVGKCPACGSPAVSDCDVDEGINDITVGRCFECGQLWCLECGTLFQEGQTCCRHWNVCAKCDSGAGDEFCGVITSECNLIEKWRQQHSN